MNQYLTIVDNFHPDPLTLRGQVISSKFQTERGPDGALYTGISKHEDPGLYYLLSKATGRKVVPKLQCFRASYKNELPHNFAHADTVCASHAALLYLNMPDQCLGGTAFWTHVNSGLDYMPNVEELVSAGIEDPAAWVKDMEADWVIENKWAMTGLVGMKFNRLVVYPTKVFHGRYPFEAFGETLADARLIWVCFFDYADEHTTTASA